MIFTLLTAAGLFYNVEYKPMNVDYIHRPEAVKISFANNNLSYEKRQRLFKWCKSYAKKSVKNSDINTIIDEVYKTSEHPLLMLALISVESNFNKNAVSHKGAQGLGQVMPLWIPEFKQKFGIKNRTDLRNIGKNIQAANYILTYYIKKEGNLADGLNRYVNGSNAYIKKVLTRWSDIMFYSKFGNYYTNKY